MPLIRFTRARGLAPAWLVAALLASATMTATPGLALGAPADRLDIAETSYGNYLAALVAGAKRDTGAAAFYWREALRGDPRNQEILGRAFVTTLADGDVGDARPLAEKVIARDQKNGLARILLGVRGLKNRQFVAARKQFARVAGRGANADLTARLLTAWTYVGSGDLAKALSITDKTVRDPGLAAYRDFFAGLMADVGGNREEALRRLKAASDADPGVVRVADAYARLLARNGDRDAAMKVYEKLEGQFGGQPLIAQPLAEMKAGKVPDPLVSTVTEGAAELFYGLGTLGGRAGDEVAALIYLQLSRYLDPRNEIAGFTMAEIFEQIEQYDKAASVYESIPADSALKSRAVIRNAVSLDKLKRSDEAIAALRSQIARDPDDLDAVDTLAALLRVRKDWMASADVYTAAIARIEKPTRRNWNLFYGRGIAYERAKQWPKAEADLQKSLDLLPTEPAGPSDRRDRAQVLNYLGYSWADMGVHIDEAFPMLQKAVELAPTDGYIVDSLGWAYYRRGHYDDAVRELEKAIELKPADPTINDHLGDAYWRVGRRLEAKFQWNHARDLKPEPDEVAKILAKIENGIQDETPATAAEPDKKNGG